MGNPQRPITLVTQADRILKARMEVILAAPFFGSLLMRLKMMPDPGVPTFRTDGRVIRYNEDFAGSLSDPELRGVLVHEVCHCAHGHLWRMGQRDPDGWNRATDYAINGMLDSFVTEERTRFELQHGPGRFVEPWALPGGQNAGLLDHSFDGLSSEEIYARLPEPPPSPSGTGNSSPSNSPPAPQSAGSPSCGEIEQPADNDPNAPTSLEDEWKIAVTQAATVAKMRGELPASLARLVGELLEPKVPWRQVLREFIRALARDDYSWGRPNRRYLPQGVILPSLHSERMGRLAIAVDTSGSIDDHTLAEFQAEIQAALDECQPECVEVIYCDAAIKGVEEFQPGDAVRLDAKGGGGTNFQPVFDHIDQTDEPPVACIYLTDGDGRFPKTEPEYPVLWASTGRSEFPFGQVVALK